MKVNNHKDLSLVPPSLTSAALHRFGVKLVAASHHQQSLGNWPCHRGKETESKTPVPRWLNLIPLPGMQVNTSRIYIVLCAGSINIDPPFPVCGVNEAFSIPTALWGTYVKPPLPLSMPFPPTQTHTADRLRCQEKTHKKDRWNGLL